MLKNLIKTTTLARAARQKIQTLEAEKVSINGGGNWHLQDIFGGYHRFFRPFCHTTKPHFLYFFDDAYFYSHNEIIFTRQKAVVLDHTSLRAHPLSPNLTHASRAKALYHALKAATKYLAFRVKSLFAHRIEGAVLLLSRNRLEQNYGHFLIECMASYHLARRFGAHFDFVVLDNSLPFQREIIELLGIPTHKILPALPRRICRAKTLIAPSIIADYEIIELRAHLHYGSLGASSRLVSFYRQNAAICRFDAPPTLKLFITRQNATFRFATNNAEVEAIFREFGYQIIDDKALSLRELISLCNRAKIIAGIHGAGLTNILFAPKDSHLFVLETEYFHDGYFVTLAAALGLSYHYIVGETSDTSMHPRLENATFAGAKLRAALGILEGKIR